MLENATGTPGDPLVQRRSGLARSTDALNETVDGPYGEAG
jgi:hypothetical protein